MKNNGYKNVSELYEAFESWLNEQSFLMLDNLTYTDSETYRNMSEQEKSAIDYLTDDINEENNQKMTTRNMHAIPGQKIDISKISLISGNTPIEIVKKIYDKYKKLKQSNNLEVDYLENEEDLISGFIDFLKQKNNENEKKLINDEGIRAIAKAPEVATKKIKATDTITKLERTQEISLGDE